MGKKFFYIEFEESKDKETALASIPWFYGRKYLYTFPWVPDFNVTTGHYNLLPVWIEITYRSLILEKGKIQNGQQFGKSASLH